MQNAWVPQQSKGVADFDTTHLFSASVVYPLPIGKTFLSTSNRLVDAVLGGWQVSAIWHSSTGSRRVWAMAATGPPIGN